MQKTQADLLYKVGPGTCRERWKLIARLRRIHVSKLSMTRYDRWVAAVHASKAFTVACTFRIALVDVAAESSRDALMFAGHRTQGMRRMGRTQRAPEQRRLFYGGLRCYDQCFVRPGLTAAIMLTCNVSSEFKIFPSGCS